MSPTQHAPLRKQCEVNPLDQFAHHNLGSMLLRIGHPKEALLELEAAAKIQPQNEGIRVEIGKAQLFMGERDKALATFEGLSSLSSKPSTWNQVAYALAQGKESLDTSILYATKAIQTVEKRLCEKRLGHGEVEQEEDTSSLASY